MCHARVAKAILATSVRAGAGELWIPARGIFCIEMWGFCLSQVPGMKLVGISFLCNSKSFTHIHWRAVPTVTLA